MGRITLPQEVQEAVIDKFVENWSRDRRKEAMNLRLVSRAWIPRLDFYAFRSLRTDISQCRVFLSMVQSSTFSVGLHVRQLFVYRQEILSEGNQFPRHDSVALQGYLRDFIESLPHLESLKLEGLYPDQMTWVPCFPTIRALGLHDVSLQPSQLLGLISSAKLLENLKIGDCDLYEEDPNQSLSPSNPSFYLQNLKSYEIFLVSARDKAFLHSYLFPFSLKPKLPSLSRLSLRGVDPNTMPVAAHLVNAISQSLQHLQLWFRRTYEEDKG
jgi:hypothetical protein